MTMTRRGLCTAALLATGLPTLTLAQPPQEGRQYQRLRTPLPVANPKGEVLEFFWYGCPHCHALEPALTQWLARKPAEVSFRRSPAVIRAAGKAHQRIFFTLEAMGLADSLHAQLFTALQVEHQEMQELPKIQAYLARYGVDAAKFGATYESFGVQTRCLQANALFKPFENEGVPQLLVNGRFITSPSFVDGADELLRVVDHLLSLPVA